MGVARERMLARCLAVGLGASALAAGCSSSELAEPDPILAPDAGIELTSAGCELTISYPLSEDGVATDALTYGASGRLVSHRRDYADGLVAVREWQWNGDEATRAWSDGSRVSRFSADGRPLGSDTFDGDGQLEWTEVIEYDGSQPRRRVVTDVAGNAVTLTGSYYYDGEQIRQVRIEAPGEPTQSVMYSFDIRWGDLQMTQAYDVDTDGVIDFKTAVLIDAEGLVKRGVDAAGQLIEYTYEGERCTEVSSRWILGDPFFLDM